MKCSVYLSSSTDQTQNLINYALAQRAGLILKMASGRSSVEAHTAADYYVAFKVDQSSTASSQDESNDDEDLALNSIMLKLLQKSGATGKKQTKIESTFL